MALVLDVSLCDAKSVETRPWLCAFDIVEGIAARFDFLNLRQKMADDIT
jgi:hypothetical protein